MLRAVLDHGPVARSTIARLTGLSPASVTGHAAELARLGLIDDLPGTSKTNGTGRPHVPVDLTDDRYVIGAVHIAVKWSTIALLDIRGRVIAQTRIPHATTDPEHAAALKPPPGAASAVPHARTEPERVAGRVAEVLAAPPGGRAPGAGVGAGGGVGGAALGGGGVGTRSGAGAEDVVGRAVGALVDLVREHAGGAVLLGVGATTGGWVDGATGTVVEHPLLGWRDVPLRRLLAARTGVRVRVDGHARALLGGERLFGAARGRDSVVQLFVGNVVDAAFAAGDDVHHGPRSQAGAVAHLPLDGSGIPCPCGRVGCLQAVVSDAALARRAAEEGVVAEPDFTLLLAAARRGDPGAARLFTERARWVGRAVAMLIDLLDPEAVVVAEPGVMFLPDVLAALRAEVAARVRTAVDVERTVLPTSFGDDVLALAAGSAVLAPLYRDPLLLLADRPTRA